MSAVIRGLVLSLLANTALLIVSDVNLLISAPGPPTQPSAGPLALEEPLESTAAGWPWGPIVGVLMAHL